MRVEFIKTYPPWQKGDLVDISENLIVADDLLRRRVVRGVTNGENAKVTNGENAKVTNGENAKQKQSPNRNKAILSAANK